MTNNVDLMVCGLIANIEWNLFDNDTIKNILKIHLPMEPMEDEFVWLKTRSGNTRWGVFSSLIRILDFIKGMKFSGRNCGVLNCMTDLNSILWRMPRVSLPWAHVEGSVCPPCNSSSDTFQHLFGSCAYYRIVWCEYE